MCERHESQAQKQLTKGNSLLIFAWRAWESVRLIRRVIELISLSIFSLFGCRNGRHPGLCRPIVSSSPFLRSVRHFSAVEEPTEQRGLTYCIVVTCGCFSPSDVPMAYRNMPQTLPLPAAAQLFGQFVGCSRRRAATCAIGKSLAGYKKGSDAPHATETAPSSNIDRSPLCHSSQLRAHTSHSLVLPFNLHSTSSRSITIASPTRQARCGPDTLVREGAEDPIAFYPFI